MHPRLALPFAASALPRPLAQVYPGEEVTVNPSAIGHGYLLYPGGKYGRNVGNLLKPGERRPVPSSLHMPVKRRHARAAPPPLRRSRAVAPPLRHPQHNRSLRPAAAEPAETCRARRRADGTPADRTAASGKPTARCQRAHGAPAAAPAAAAPLPSSSGSSPCRASPPPRSRERHTAASHLTAALNGGGPDKRSVIPFAAGAADRPQSALARRSPSLNAAHDRRTARAACSLWRTAGDKGSDSRRLSLKRALVIRELLIEDGVPSEKIDVRAMGGVDDSGAADRVDVFVRA